MAIITFTSDGKRETGQKNSNHTHIMGKTKNIIMLKYIFSGIVKRSLWNIFIYISV